MLWAACCDEMLSRTGLRSVTMPSCTCFVLSGAVRLVPNQPCFVQACTHGQPYTLGFAFAAAAQHAAGSYWRIGLHRHVRPKARCCQAQAHLRKSVPPAMLLRAVIGTAVDVGLSMPGAAKPETWRSYPAAAVSMASPGAGCPASDRGR